MKLTKTFFDILLDIIKIALVGVMGVYMIVLITSLTTLKDKAEKSFDIFLFEKQKPVAIEEIKPATPELVISFLTVDSQDPELIKTKEQMFSDFFAKNSRLPTEKELFELTSGAKDFVQVKKAIIQKELAEKEYNGFEKEIIKETTKEEPLDITEKITKELMESNGKLDSIDDNRQKLFNDFVKEKLRDETIMFEKPEHD